MTNTSGGSHRGGFALPFALFLAAMLTIMLAASFTRAAVDAEVSDSGDASVSALTVAQTGLQAFLSDTFTVRPLPGDSFRYNVVGGYAWIHPDELQRPVDTVADDVVYAVRSTGYLIHPNQGATPLGNRTIVQLARWQIGSINIQALLSAPNGIHRRSGGVYTVEARDAGGNHYCTTGSQIAQYLSPTFPAPPIPDPTANDGLPGFTLPGTDSTLAVQTEVVWSDVVSGRFVPDSYSVLIGDTTFASQLVVGNLTLNGGDRGTGILMVTGNLDVIGGPAKTEWQGIVLVGGYLAADGQFTDFHGMVVTGLNAMFGTAVSADTVGGAGRNVSFLYEPCLIQRALDPLTGFVPVTNAVIDNWATW